MEIYNIDKSKYNTTTISLFNIVGAYFVDIFYNNFYENAESKFENGTYTSISEGYKKQMAYFLKNLDKRDVYNKMLNGITESYQKWTARPISKTSLIDKLSEQFNPDFNINLSAHQRDIMLFDSLKNVLKRFVVIILQTRLKDIIDSRDDKEHILILQDDMLSALLVEREHVICSFLDPTLNNQSVPIHVFLKLKEELTEQVKENMELEKKIVELTTLCTKRAVIIEGYQNEYTKLQNDKGTLVNIINDIRSEYAPSRISRVLPSEIDPLDSVSQAGHRIHRIPTADVYRQISNVPPKPVKVADYNEYSSDDDRNLDLDLDSDSTDDEQNNDNNNNHRILNIQNLNNIQSNNNYNNNNHHIPNNNNHHIPNNNNHHIPNTNNHHIPNTNNQNNQNNQNTDIDNQNTNQKEIQPQVINIFKNDPVQDHGKDPEEIIPPKQASSKRSRSKKSNKVDLDDEYNNLGDHLNHDMFGGMDGVSLV